MPTARSKGFGRAVMVLTMSLTGAVAHGDGAIPPIVIDDCTVYSERDSAIAQSCTAQARKACSDADTCELPIGLALTSGRDIDGDTQTWELVRVRYSCGSEKRVRGPHHQNDHATMTLTCRGDR